MKKIALTVTALAFVVSGMAQQKNIETALSALKEGNFDEAKEYIDKAEVNPETKDKSKTLFAKGQIYFGMMASDKYKNTSPWKEGAQALLKLAETKPDYEKEDVNILLMYAAGLYYNAGSQEYNDKKSTEAVEDLKNAVKITELGGGKRFEKAPRGKLMDTLSANAQLTIARVAYYSNNYADAITQLNKLKTNPIVKSVENYNILLDAYDHYNTNNANKLSAEEFATIQEAVAAYPSDPNVKASELNYYIKNNKLAELLKKVEEAAGKEPNNAELQLTLAMTYQGLANPKDGKKPADAADMNSKAEAAYLKAVALAPENSNINYNLGTLYFNEGVEFNAQMVDITGSTAADNKKFEALKVKRDGMFEKAFPYLDKTNTLLSAKSKLSNDEQDSYRGALTALKQIYAVQNKVDKMQEMKKKLADLDAAGK